ncbi:MAG: glycosyltransferase family 2 protein [Armatimonadota bacterium]
MCGKKVSAIIPAYNEAETITATVKAALSLPFVSEVVVVDDGSKDETAVLAEQAGATKVIRHPRNMGKGEAMNTGLKAASGDVLLLLDGDLGETASEGFKLLEPVLNGQADMTIARFPRRTRGGGFGIALRIARWGVRTLTGRPIQFPLSGQRAVRRSVIEDIGGFPPRFAVETGMTIDVLRRGYRVLEVDTNMSHRVTGRDAAGFLHRGKQLFDIAAAVLKRSVLFGLKRPKRQP